MDNYYKRIKEADPRDRTLTLTIVEGSLAGMKALCINGEIIVADPPFKSLLSAGLTGRDKRLDLSGKGLITEAGQTIYYEELVGKRKLVICGAGHVGLAVIRLARQISYHVTVIDDREEFVEMARLAGADVVLCGSFTDQLARIRGDKDTAFIIVTRGHCNDFASLKEILKKDYAYIGVMGSRRKTEMISEKLLLAGYDEETIGQIHMPIGLKIGARTPEEIAIAILGDIIEVCSRNRRYTTFPDDILKVLCDKEEKRGLADGLCILATVILKKGSGPRDAGAKMLLFPDGKRIGTVGGGFVEARTIKEAGEMFSLNKEGEPEKTSRQLRRISVNLDAVTMEDGGMICGGRMDVFLEMISENREGEGPDDEDAAREGAAGHCPGAGRLIYLDNAATTMLKPPEVSRAVNQALNTYGNAGRGAHGESLSALRGIYEARQVLADLFGAQDPSRIAFTANATESLNMAIKGVLNPGDHVISTVLEHNSVLRPLYEMEKKGTRISLISCDEKGMPDYEDFEREIRSNTRAIICTHASNLTGNILDIKRIGRIARKHGLMFIVDASQTAGYADIDVQDMNIDILCFTGHKSLLGPQGTGGIYVREEISIRPLVTGGSGIRTYDKDHPHNMPEALEAGTVNGHGIAGLCAGVSFLRQTGLAKIREKEQELMQSFYQEIRHIDGVRIYGDFSTMNRCPIISFNIGEEDSGRIADALNVDYGIAVRAGGHCAPLMHQALGTVSQGAVRVSFSWFNTMEDVREAARAVRELAE